MSARLAQPLLALSIIGGLFLAVASPADVTTVASILAELDQLAVNVSQIGG